MSDNPFQSYPETAVPSKSEVALGLDGPAEMLRKTMPWVKIFSILIFLGGGFLLLGGVLVVMAEMSTLDPSLSLAIGGFYVFLAIMYFIPATLLWKYGQRIGVFVQTRSTESLTSALASQMHFWRFVVISVLVLVAFYLAMLVFAFFLAISTRMNM